MSFSPDPHPGVKRPFDNANDANSRSTQPLNGVYDFTDMPSAAQPKVTIPLTTPVTSTKQPVVIPAVGKQRRKDTTKREHLQRSKRPLALFGVLFASIIILTIVASFVAPLWNGQRSQSLAQTVNNWGEGYCGGSDIWGTCAMAVTASGVMGTGQMQRPIQGATITQYFGHPEYQQWCGCWRPHTGIDLAAAYGTAVTAADSGQVIWTGWDWSGLGWAVKINHGHYIATIYGHLQRFIVKVGENVTKGQVIGYEGSTGASTGPHVHFMVLYNNVWENPVNYVQLP